MSALATFAGCGVDEQIYNATVKDNPELMFPAVVVAIDNFAEFRENYEYLMGDLIGMAGGVPGGRSIRTRPPG